MGKIVYTAEKQSYGSEFTYVCNSLEELKHAIAEHGSLFRREKVPYSEELVKEIIEEDGYVLHQIDLHEDEEIVFHDYDGQSWFTIEKITKNILSTSQVVKA